MDPVTTYDPKKLGSRTLHDWLRAHELLETWLHSSPEKRKVTPETLESARAYLRMHMGECADQFELSVNAARELVIHGNFELPGKVESVKSDCPYTSDGSRQELTPLDDSHG